MRGKNSSRHDAILQSLHPGDTDALTEAVFRQVRLRLEEFTNGVQRYHRAPPPPSRPVPTTVWQEGNTRLLDYCAGPSLNDSPPLLIIPSLINRSYILDLAEDKSLVSHLADQGFRPLLVDWRSPSTEEMSFTLSDYVNRRLQPALDHILRDSVKRPALIGYCMGGNLALALAQINISRISALALLATPWDFHAGGSGGLLISTVRTTLEHLISLHGHLPVDVLQAMFAAMDPVQTGAKYRRFARSNSDSDWARRFVMLEDWVNDGVPLAGPVASECLFGWYVDNAPLHLKWMIDGKPVDPRQVSCPALCAIPAADHIVPPESARALLGALPNATELNPNAGHIGMVAGTQAEGNLYLPLSKWLSRNMITD